MKPEIYEKLINTLDQDIIKKIMESEDFYFQKAVDKYNEMMKLPKLSEEVTMLWQFLLTTNRCYYKKYCTTEGAYCKI
ncbi:hypothetical protein [Clostridium sp.]|uniref:hypothetical protein n=1 Tax=Clostridium sp. TaxID=1506 RepID=UPI003F4BF07B